MFFFTQVEVGIGIIKSCRCGRQFTAHDWLDIKPKGLMDSGEDTSILDLRNCPCGSTIGLEIPLFTQRSA